MKRLFVPACHGKSGTSTVSSNFMDLTDPPSARPFDHHAPRFARPSLLIVDFQRNRRIRQRRGHLGTSSEPKHDGPMIGRIIWEKRSGWSSTHTASRPTPLGTEQPSTFVTHVNSG